MSSRKEDELAKSQVEIWERRDASQEQSQNERRGITPAPLPQVRCGR